MITGRRNNLRAIFGLAAVAAAGLVHAEDTASPGAGDGSLDEIVVVANKAERSLREVAANVTVLTRESMADELSTSLGESFRYTPGIDEEWAGGRFGSEGISIRGVGGNRVALVVDGVQLGDQYDIGSFANATRDFIDAGFIRRVEVLHGPASALYGSDAIGGVVSVRTLLPADLVGPDDGGGTVSALWHGADDSLHGTALAAFGNAARGIVFGGSRREGGARDSAALSEPVDERDFRRTSALINVASDDVLGRRVSAGLLYQDSVVDTDLHSMLGSGRFAATTELEGSDASRLAVAHADLAIGGAGGVVHAGVLRLYAGQSRIDQDTRDVRANAARPVIIDRQFEYDQAFHGFEANLQRDFDAGTVTHRLGAGLEYRRTRTEELRDGTETGIEDGASQSIILGEEFPLRDFPVTDTEEWGVYLEDAVLLRDVTVIAAVRADRYDLSPREDAIYADDNPSAEPASLSESDLSPKLGLVWHATDRADLFLQYAHGFRAPPFDDANIGLDIPLFKYRAIPNPDLQSESSDGFDAGVRLQGSLGYVRFGLFHTVYDDFIESKARLGYDAASDRVLFQSRNIGEARISGIEGSFSAILPHSGETLSIDGSFYAARGENRENGEALNSVGPAQAVLGFNWTSPDGRRQLRLATTLTDAWTDRDESAGELFEPPGYALFDLLFSQALGERSVLRAGLMNLTDRTWWQWTTVGGLPPDDPLLPTLAQPGRNLSIGIEWHW